MEPQIFGHFRHIGVTKLTKICIEDRDIFIYSTLISWKREELRQVNLPGRIDVQFTMRGVQEVEVLEGEPEKPHYPEF